MTKSARLWKRFMLVWFDLFDYNTYDCDWVLWVDDCEQKDVVTATTFISTESTSQNISKYGQIWSHNIWLLSTSIPTHAYKVHLGNLFWSACNKCMKSLVKSLANVLSTCSGRNSGSPRSTRNLVGLPKMMIAVVRGTTTKFGNIFQIVCLSCYFA